MAAPGQRQSSSISENDVGLRGRLEQFGLATVLTFLDLERRSGEILVVAGDRLGRVNRAAIYELLSWERGRFAFTQADLSSAPDEIGAPTALLLVEAARRADEAAAPAG